MTDVILGFLWRIVDAVLDTPWYWRRVRHWVWRRYYRWRGLGRKVVDHVPEYVPTMLRCNAAGDMKPGFECVHQLENGNGPCGGNVFTLDQDTVMSDSCVVISRGGQVVKIVTGIMFWAVVAFIVWITLVGLGVVK